MMTRVLIVQPVFASTPLALSLVLYCTIIVIIIPFGYTALCVFCFINKIITIIYIINAAGRPGVIGRWLYTIHGVHTVEK